MRKDDDAVVGTARDRGPVLVTLGWRRWLSVCGLALLAILGSAIEAMPANAADVLTATPVLGSFSDDGTYDLLVTYDRPGFTAQVSQPMGTGECTTDGTSCVIKGIYGYNNEFVVEVVNDQPYQDRPVVVMSVLAMGSIAGPATARADANGTVIARLPDSSLSSGNVIASAWPGGQQCSTWEAGADWTTGVRECPIPNLTPGQQYKIVLSSVRQKRTMTDGSAVMEWSWAQPVSIVAVDVPGVVPNVAADAAARSVTVSWGAAAPRGADVLDYTATLSPSGASCTVASSALGCTLTGLAPATSYSVAVTARNALGSSSPSVESVATTPDVPDAPGGLLASADASSITGKWLAASGNGSPITGYRMEVSLASDGQAVGNCVTTVITCTVAGLLEQTDYRVSVVALNAVGVSVPAVASSRTLAALKNVAGSVAMVKNLARPYIAGSPRVGRTVRANVGYWNPSSVDRFRFVWTLNGKPVKGATKGAFRLTKRMAGKKLRVVVVADRAGYTSGQTTSAPVKVRKKR